MSLSFSAVRVEIFAVLINFFLSNEQSWTVNETLLTRFEQQKMVDNLCHENP
jgi:hypothetical protein